MNKKLISVIVIAGFILVAFAGVFALTPSEHDNLNFHVQASEDYGSEITEIILYQDSEVDEDNVTFNADTGEAIVNGDGLGEDQVIDKIRVNVFVDDDSAIESGANVNDKTELDFTIEQDGTEIFSETLSGVAGHEDPPMDHAYTDEDINENLDHETQYNFFSDFFVEY